MSEPSLKGQEPKAVSCCHDPPQYDSYRGSQDLLTSIIENEHTGRKSVRRIHEMDTEMANMLKQLKKKTPLKTPDWNLIAEFLEELGGVCTEMVQIFAGLVNACKERAVHTDLYKAISKLNDDELERIYDSLKRDPNRQIQHELAQDHEDRGDSDSRHNFQCSSTTKQVERAGNYNSCGRFAELLAKMDKVNEKSGQKIADGTTAKSPVSFWKKFFRHSARP